MAASTPSTADFIARYPEFNGAGATLVGQKLAEAARRTSSEVYQTDELTSDAVMVRAAVLLYISPYGSNMRATNPTQAAAWEYQLRSMQRSATQGLRVF